MICSLIPCAVVSRKPLASQVRGQLYVFSSIKTHYLNELDLDRVYFGQRLSHFCQNIRSPGFYCAVVLAQLYRQSLVAMFPCSLFHSFVYNVPVFYKISTLRSFKLSIINIHCCYLVTSCQVLKEYSSLQLL